MIRLLQSIARVFDRLQARWEWLTTHRAMGAVFVAVYLAALGVIELNRLGLLSGQAAAVVGTSHYGAVNVAFTGLLVVEILSLVFVLADSVATSVGKQFELFALILLRKAFMAFGAMGEPIEWGRSYEELLVIGADIAGALLVFFLLGAYYRLQRHQPIVAGAAERASFIAAKKAVALLLLGAFALLGILELRDAIGGSASWDFFQSFYTLLVFSDILLVLLSLSFNSSFSAVFRNTGFAAATILLRLALTAPPFFNAVTGLAALLVAIGLTVAYNLFPVETAGHR
ncbi:MAG: hypothetical protein R2882_13490 [Gemmatimonadales bacterium]